VIRRLLTAPGRHCAGSADRQCEKTKGRTSAVTFASFEALRTGTGWEVARIAALGRRCPLCNQE
jgi:hypothetical protein